MTNTQYGKMLLWSICFIHQFQNYSFVASVIIGNQTLAFPDNEDPMGNSHNCLVSNYSFEPEMDVLDAFSAIPWFEIPDILLKFSCYTI